MSKGLLAAIDCWLTSVPHAICLNALTSTVSLLPGLGGVALFDLIGRILGPAIVNLCVAVLKIYMRSRRAAGGYHSGARNRLIDMQAFAMRRLGVALISYRLELGPPPRESRR